MDGREFDKVFWDLHPRLLRHARHYLDPAGAEEAVAEALLTLWKKNQPFPHDDAACRQLRAFAFRILVGIIGNEHRSRRRSKRLRKALEGDALALPQQQNDAAIADSRLAVDHWLGQLSQSDREVVLLINAGFGIEEIAQILRCSTSAAAKRRTRARARLKAIVEAEGRTPS